ncbi:hypothetical protein ACE6H2_014211 [Prunus campanulata]
MNLTFERYDPALLRCIVIPPDSELSESSPDGRTPPNFLYLGNSIGVPFFHKQILRHFNESEASEEETFDARDTGKESRNMQIRSIVGASAAGLSGIFVALLKGNRKVLPNAFSYIAIAHSRSKVVAGTAHNFIRSSRVLEITKPFSFSS